MALARQEARVLTVGVAAALKTADGVSEDAVGLAAGGTTVDVVVRQAAMTADAVAHRAGDVVGMTVDAGVRREGVSEGGSQGGRRFHSSFDR